MSDQRTNPAGMYNRRRWR